MHLVGYMDFVRNAIAIEPTRSKMTESISLDLEPQYMLTVMYEQAVIHPPVLAILDGKYY